MFTDLATNITYEFGWLEKDKKKLRISANHNTNLDSWGTVISQPVPSGILDMLIGNSSIDYTEAQIFQILSDYVENKLPSNISIVLSDYDIKYRYLDDVVDAKALVICIVTKLPSDCGYSEYRNEINLRVTRSDKLCNILLERQRLRELESKDVKPQLDTWTPDSYCYTNARNETNTRKKIIDIIGPVIFASVSCLGIFIVTYYLRK